MNDIANLKAGKSVITQVLARIFEKLLIYDSKFEFLRITLKSIILCPQKSIRLNSICRIYKNLAEGCLPFLLSLDNKRKSNESEVEESKVLC